MLRRTAVLLSALLPGMWLLVTLPPAWATSVTVPVVAHTVTGVDVRTAELRLPTPATRVAVYWRGAAEADVALAFSADGRSFSTPIKAGRDEVGEQRRNGITYGSVHVVQGARVVRVVSDRPLSQVWVDGMADGAAVVTRVRTPAAAWAAAVQPTVLTRASWGADESLRYQADGVTLKQSPTYYPSKKLIVHHTDTTNGDPDPAATIRAIYRYHVLTQGWADIGYNFFVDESGRAWEGRWSRTYDAGLSPTGDDAAGRGVTGSHTGGWNSGTVGVALLGSLVDRDATAAARTGVVDLLAWLAQKNGLDPKATVAFTNPVSGATTTTPNIAGHRDYSATECPGGAFYATLPALRQQVADKLVGPADVVAPSTPTSLVAAPGFRSAALSWAAATDDRGVTGYEVFRSTSSTGTYSLRSTTVGTSYDDTGLKTGRTYWYRVRAYDAAGNRSALSGPASTTAR